MRNLKAYNVELDDGTEVKVYRATKKEDAHLVGVHRLYPSMDEIQDAIETAIKDGFEKVILHSSKTWPYKINK